MADIFVSYRRGDSAGHTGRLVDSLVRHFGRDAVFQDVQSIDAGRRWDEAIDDGVSRCRVLVAVIGRDWLAAGQDGRRRIDDPHDHLRREIATALERRIPVIPALVEGARMPAGEDLPDELGSLAHWQAHELSDSRWEYDTGRLLTMVERAMGITPAKPPAAPGRSAPRRWSMAAVAAALLAAGTMWLLPRGAPPAADRVPATQAPSAADGSGAGSRPPPIVDIAPARFEGDWYDEEATHWGIRSKGDGVEINHTAPGSGTAIGYAEGRISDRTISFEYVVMVPDEPRLNGQLVLSDDGTRLTGVLTDLENGGNTRIVLHRQKP